MGIRLVPKPIKIGPLDGFSKSDIFEAKHTGEHLANIVGDLEGHSVIVLDGAWGTGKSVFVQQWAGLLRQRGHPVVYFDAFAHDHLDDAFFPLLGALLRVIDSGKSSFTRIRENLIEKATPLVRAIPGIVGDLTIRRITDGQLNAKDISDNVERLRTKMKDTTKGMIKECLDHVDKHIGSIGEFRAELEGAVSGMEDRDGKPPLVFIIDELDRCRPTYALSVLERMKHVFDADGVCFVLITHLTELARMVERAYGLKNADVYLHKFYHRRFDFEKLLNRGSEKLRLRYLNYLATSLGIGRDPGHLATRTIDNLTRIHSVSLRGQERIMVNQALFDTAIPARAGSPTHSTGFWSDIAPSLTVMRHVDPSLFRLASSRRLTFSKAMEFIQIKQWINIGPGGKKHIEQLWKLATIDGFEDASDDEKMAHEGAGGTDARQQRVAATCAVIDQLG